MARPGRPERSRTTRSSCQLRRFQCGITLESGFWYTQVEAVVTHQVLGRLWPLAFGKVGRRAHDSHPQVRTDPNSYHVLGDKLAGADTCIDLLGDDVGQPVVDDNLDMNVRKFRQNRP